MKNEVEMKRLLEQLQEGEIKIEDLSEELKNDKEFMLEVLKRYSEKDSELKYIFGDNGVTRIAEAAGDELKKDQDFMLECIKKGSTYELLLESPAFKTFSQNPEFMLEAVKIDGSLYLYVESENVKKNPQIIYEAICQYDNMIDYYQYEKMEEVLNNPQIIMQLLKIDKTNDDFLEDTIKANLPGFVWDHDDEIRPMIKEQYENGEIDDMFLKKVARFNGGLNTMGYELQNREIVLEGVRHAGWQLEDAKDEFKSDEEIVLAAIRQDTDATEYINEDLKNNEEFMKKVEKIIEENRQEKNKKYAKSYQEVAQSIDISKKDEAARVVQKDLQEEKTKEENKKGDESK